MLPGAGGRADCFPAHAAPSSPRTPLGAPPTEPIRPWPEADVVSSTPVTHPLPGTPVHGCFQSFRASAEITERITPANGGPCSPHPVGGEPVTSGTRGGHPVTAAAARRAVEDAPRRPHEVDVARVLARLREDHPPLAAPEVVDPALAADEHAGHRELLLVRPLGPVVPVERGVPRTERPRACARAVKRSAGAFATTAKLMCCPRRGTAPSTPSMIDVQSGRGTSTGPRGPGLDTKLQTPGRCAAGTCPATATGTRSPGTRSRRRARARETVGETRARPRSCRPARHAGASGRRRTPDVPGGQAEVRPCPHGRLQR